MLNVGKVGTTPIVCEKSFNSSKPVVFKGVDDVFEKSPKQVSELQNILNDIGLPEYVSATDMKKPVLGIGKSVQKQAFLKNGSAETDAQGAKCIEAINAYLKEQIQKGNVEILSASTGAAKAKLADGTIIRASEPYGMLIGEYDPQKSISITFPGEENKGVDLRAYAYGKCDGLTYKTITMLQEVKK